MVHLKQISFSMNIRLIQVGKTDDKKLDELIIGYLNRLKHYVRFEVVVIPQLKNTKNLNEQTQKTKEGEEILKQIIPSDHMVLLDEKGKEFSSVEFSKYLQKQMNSGLKRLVFVIGGPYGFDEAVSARSNSSISLSKMTFSHQMVRLFFVEQVYRAFTILRNEPYHHE